MEQDLSELDRLFKTFHRMRHLMIRQAIEGRGLEVPSNPGILFLLRCKGEDSVLSQKEIADLTGVAPPTVAVSVRRMEKAGLLTKLSDERDLRRNRIALTERGRLLADEFEKASREVSGILFAGFSDEEFALLRKWCLRMIENLERAGIRLPPNFQGKVIEWSES